MGFLRVLDFRFVGARGFGQVFVAEFVLDQFARIGTLTMLQGMAGIGQDLPPFTIATGINTICGLNVIGLRRAGFSPEERIELKRLYHLLFRSGKNLSAAIAEAKEKFSGAAATVLLEFVAEAKRGVCADVSRGDLENENE